MGPPGGASSSVCRGESFVCDVPWSAGGWSCCRPSIDDATLAPVAEAIHGDRAQRWAIEQRGFWVHGVSTLGEYLKATVPFTLEGRLDAISCPTALTAAEDDPLARSDDQVYEAAEVPETLLRFTTAEGAGDHCEMRNRTLLDQRVFDWLDDTLSLPPPVPSHSAAGEPR
jgi:hypothetical protein